MAQPVAIGDFLLWYEQALQAAQVAAIAPTELEWLLERLAGLDRLTLRLLQQNSAREDLVLNCPLAQLDALWVKRVQQRTPVQYLVGSVTWRQFQLQVSPAVLIPRPETELLIDWVERQTRQNPALQKGHWADLGTGSGAIALGLATTLPTAQIHAVDCSAAALAIARQNAVLNQLGDRVQWHQGHWLEPLVAAGLQLTGLVSNPPYIPKAELALLQPEVHDHEPHLALDGGVDGLDCIRYLIQQAPKILHPGGLWLIEMMAGQGEAVADLLSVSGDYTNIQIETDLAGLDRFAIATRR
ncbi:MAG: peptide chain release factor N(5)-glutamine methyltransferase [Cyanobacteria bacterium P01_H01_bin.121]